MAAPSEVIYVFDSYRFRPDGRLTKDGKTVRLPPTESKLLELLLRSRGQLLSHRAIEEEIWPRQTVSYSSLARCIYSLRKTLGNSRQDYILTVPKRGYRFAKHVSAVSVYPSRASVTLDDLEPVDLSFFLEGLREAARASPGALQRAVDCLESVCNRVPNFVKAFEELTNCRINQINRGYIEPAYGRREGIKTAEAALVIDPHSVDINVMLAFLHGTVDDKAVQQLARLEEQIEAPISSARALLWRSSLEKCAGRLEASLRSANAALQCDPFSITARFSLAWSHFLCGNAVKALETAQECSEQMPWVPYGPAFTAMFSAYSGELDLAEEEARHALEMAQENSGAQVIAAYALACAGLGDEARNIASGAHTLEYPRPPLVHAAAVYAALGDERQVQALLERAKSEGDPWYPASRYDPRLAAVFSCTPERARGKRGSR